MRLATVVLIASVLWGTAARVTAAPAEVKRAGQVVTLTNGLVATSFDLGTGQWQAADADGATFARDLKCVLNSGGQLSTSSAAQRQFTQSPLKDSFGTGVRIDIAQAGAVPFVLVLSMYDDAPFFLVQIKLPDARGKKIRSVSLPEGKLIVGNDINQVCTLSNYWSGEWYSEIHPMELTDQRAKWNTSSHFYLCAYNRADAHSVILGSLFGKGVNKVEAAVEAADASAISFSSTCSYESELTIAADTWESPPHIVCAPRNVFDGLEAYGAVARAYRPYYLPKTPPSGWCSWDAGASDSQKELYANVDAMKKNRLDEFGLKIVQLDDGWQQGGRNTTNWRPILKRFPDGMKAVADHIRAAGFSPGLWIAPFSQQNLGDAKFPQWLANEMKLFVSDWGFHYIKADFLSYPHTFRNGTMPYSTAYTNGIRIMEDAVRKEPDGYLMTCINHEWLSVGMADGQRLGNDVHGGDLTGLYVTLKCWPRRYFTNNSFWIGDPDMMHVNLPTDEQSQVWASFVALSGGATMSGDNIPKLPASRIAILKKTLPAQGISARPCDLFDRPLGWSQKYARIWNARVQKPDIGAWNVVGLFNWTVDKKPYHGEPQNLTVDFANHLQLKPDRRYLVYDFWKGSYLGAFQKSLSLGLAPASCRVLVMHEEADIPQVLGTDRHIVSGAEDLRKVVWDAASRSLTGETETVKFIPYTIAVHIPPGYVLGAATANDQPAAIERVGDYFAKVSFDTGATGKVRWAIRFDSASTAREPTADSLINHVDVPRPDPSAAQIILPQLSPTWTDQRHDIEGGPISSADSNDLGTTAPFWMCWDVSDYAATHPKLLADVLCSDGGKMFFEVLGDGKRLYASKVLDKGQRAAVDVSITGVKQLTLIGHYVDGWFSTTRGRWINPRLQ